MLLLASPPSAVGTRYSVPNGFISNYVDAFIAQHGDQLYQRKPDQCSGIIADHALYQRNSQGFGFGAAGAIVGLLAAQVAMDLFPRKISKHDRGRHTGLLNPLRAAVIHTKCGVE